LRIGSAGIFNCRQWGILIVVSQLADMIKVVKLPEIWCIGFIIFAGYGLYVAQSYFTPYLTGVLGMSLKIALILSILRTYFLRFLGAPLGGIIADKANSASKILIFSFVLLICFILYFTFYAKDINIFFIIILIVIITLISFGIYGVMWATVEEAKIPKFLTGTAIGFIGIVGYLPDLFIHTMFGAWLDKYGVDGYQKIFLFLVVLAMMGIIGSYGVLRLRKKRSLKK
jgi:sugar phosphate permease